jgi:hypothetical protein
MKAVGKVVHAGARSFIAESMVVDGEGGEIARAESRLEQFRSLGEKEEKNLIEVFNQRHTHH